MAGPLCTMLLSDMGAEVIKVESTAHGDVSRSWGPHIQGNESAYFLSVNRNKRSLALNLKQHDGKEILRRLVARSDVLVENFRPGVLKRLGFSYEEVKRIKSDIIYCSISGYGQEGPSSLEPALDLVIQARSGLMSITGEADRPPVKMGLPVTDMTAGMYCTYAITLALLEKNRSGKGTHVDIALLDSAVSWLSFWMVGFLATGEASVRMGSAHPSVVPYQLFPAQDGWIAIAAASDVLWKRLCKAIERTDLLNDKRFATNPDRLKNRDVLVHLLSPIFKMKPISKWTKILFKEEIPASPVNSVSDVAKDPQLIYRNLFQEVEHPRAGKVVIPHNPIRFLDKEQDPIVKSPPLLGEHTREILLELSYRPEEIEKMISKAAVRIG